MLRLYGWIGKNPPQATRPEYAEPNPKKIKFRISPSESTLFLLLSHTIQLSCSEIHVFISFFLGYAYSPRDCAEHPVYFSILA